MTDSEVIGNPRHLIGFSLLSDEYDRRARLYPALLVFMPIVLLGGYGLGHGLGHTEAIAGLFASCGGLILLAQLARDAGERNEKGLFTKWGGMPSVAIFRHVDDRLDTITKERYHKQMQSLIKTTKAPTLSDERIDPVSADLTYLAWSTFLRIHTRDHKRYPLIFEELINYGYRRNVWGLRRIGIGTCLICESVAIYLPASHYKVMKTVSPELLATSLVIAFLVVLWIFVFREDWVKRPADAYAERLAESIDTLSSNSTDKTKKASKR